MIEASNYDEFIGFSWDSVCGVLPYITAIALAYAQITAFLGIYSPHAAVSYLSITDRNTGM